MFRPRGFRALQSFYPLNLGSLWLASSPFALRFYLGPRVFSSGLHRPRRLRMTVCILSCASTPLRRLSPSLAVFLPAACVDRRPPSENTSRKLPCPSAFTRPRTLFFASPADEASQRLCPALRKSRPQGLATLSAVSAPRSLESLFQPSTLLGFPLQSLYPLK
jgi:hypothetical protein